MRDYKREVNSLAVKSKTIKQLNQINVKHISFTLGVLFAILHIIGTILIQFKIIRYIEVLHFMDMTYYIQPFSLLLWLIGIGFAFLVGCFIGWLYATMYNYFSKNLR